MIHIAIAAPVYAVRLGLKAMLSAEFQVVHEAASLEELEPFLKEADILLIVTESPGPELRSTLQAAEGRLALLLLTDDSQAAHTLPSLPLRAWGVLSIDATAEELAAALHALNEGLWVGHPALVRQQAGRFIALEAGDAETLIDPLTERESQVLQLLAHGLANKQIAVRLGISEHTVKFHVSAIYAKMGVTNRTEAVRKGAQQGLILL